MKVKILALLLAILSCSAHAQDTHEHHLEVNDDAPLFTLNDLHGQVPLSLNEYKGKVVYIDFWASWCGPCRTSFPILSDLYDDYHSEGFSIISVNLDEDREKALDFLEQYPVSFSHLAGFGTQITKTYDIHAMPTGIFVDTKGKIRLIHMGFKSSHKDFIEAVLQKLLAEK